MCIGNMRKLVRDRPTLAGAATIPEQSRACLDMIDRLSLTLDYPEEAAMQDLTIRVQAAIAQYADYEIATSVAQPPSPAFRARHARERNEFWLEMVRSVDALERSIRDLSG